MSEGIDRRTFLQGGLAALLSHRSAVQEKTPQEVLEEAAKHVQNDERDKASALYVRLINDMQKQHGVKPSDPKAYKQLATAYYELAGCQWKDGEALYWKSKNGETAYQSPYEAARTFANRALTLHTEGEVFAGLDERVATCYHVMGSSAMRIGNAKQGLEDLRKGFFWSTPKMRIAVSKEIFLHYMKNDLQDIITEFKTESLKESLLDVINATLPALDQQGKPLPLDFTTEEKRRNALHLYGYLLAYANKKEMAKPVDERDSHTLLDYFFAHYTLRHALAKDEGKAAVVEIMKRAYTSGQKEFKESQDIGLAYRAWRRKREQTPLEIPGSVELGKKIRVEY